MKRTLLIGLALVACEKARERPGAEPCVTWEGEARSVLEQRCSTCHSGRTPAGAWDVTTYLGALGGGSDDAPNAVAGDPASPMLAKIEPSLADEIHREVTDAHPLLARWTSECRLALRDSRIHTPGIQNPDDPEFHGELLRSTGWDFALCAKCHGDNFSGGGARSSCRSCHEQGPTDCSTCHHDGIDAEHRAHAFGCETCHAVPKVWTDPGHLDPPPAEVTLPSWDGVRCSDVKCHGIATPTWEAGIGQADCGTCHGNPPPDHPNDRCVECHQRTELHMNGRVDLGRTDDGCQGCHGEPDAPAPASGAHRSHLLPQLRLRRAIDCSDCHLVPETATSPGHLDSDLPAEVFPAAIREVSLAFAGGTEASFEPSAGTCAVYCHGEAFPTWSGSEDQVACGSCHGVPPEDATHDPSWQLSDCARCHATAVDPFGNPLPEGEHLDGNVDF